MKLFTMLLVTLVLAFSSAFAGNCNHDDCDGVNSCENCTCNENAEGCTGDCCDCEAEACDEECTCECEDCECNSENIEEAEESEGHGCGGCHGNGEC